LISKSPYQQLVDDKELIVDKVVLINKDPYIHFSYFIDSNTVRVRSQARPRVAKVHRLCHEKTK
jgi:hypothetical protein